MANLYVALFIVILIVTIFIPLYLSLRLLFASTPFVINYYSKEKANWYNDWNTQRFFIVLVLFLLSFGLSKFWGGILLADIHTQKIDFPQILLYILFQILAVILFEGKMEHPFKPIQAFRKFNKNNYNERFEFREKQNTADIIENNSKEIKEEISKGNQIISKGFQQQEQILSEATELAKLNNKILQETDFAFEIKKSPNLAIADIIHHYFISKDSEKVLSDFLLRQKKSGKILFIKPAKNGVSVRPILDFFSTFTNLIEDCRSRSITQADTIKIINSISSAEHRLGNVDEEPVNAKNLSKYLSESDFREEI